MSLAMISVPLPRYSTRCSRIRSDMANFMLGTRRSPATPPQSFLRSLWSMLYSPGPGVFSCAEYVGSTAVSSRVMFLPPNSTPPLALAMSRASVTS